MVEAAVLVGKVVVERDAVGNEVLRVRARVESPQRGGEAQAVGGGKFADAPVPDDGQGGLVVDEDRVGQAEGLGAQVVLLGPEQLVAGAARLVLGDHRLDPDVARLGHEHRRGRDDQMFGAAARLGDVVEVVEESGPGVDFEEELGPGADALGRALAVDDGDQFRPRLGASAGWRR